MKFSMKQSVFVIRNMDCPTEEKLIRKRLAGVEGIKNLSFDLLERTLTVDHLLESDVPILTALNDIGMKVAGGGEANNKKTGSGPPAVSNRAWLLIAISGCAAVAAEAVVWMGAGETAPQVVILSFFSIATGGISTLRKGWIALKTFTLNMNFLMSIAMIGALSIGEWPEAAMVIFLFALAELIESLSLERATNAVRGLMAMAPETAIVKQENGVWSEMAAGAVQPGQIVRVKPGARIPLDGVITAGGSSVNQAPITGESIPVTKKPGDTVFAGTVNERGSFEFRVTADKGHTTLARIIHSIQEAQGKRAPTQRFVDRFARYYTPAVVMIAVLVAVGPTLLFGAAFIPWFYKALVMLVIACPCALVISTPVTVVSGLTAAARQGILVKGGVHLENGRLLKAIALDKTGTLTHGRPEVTDIVPLAGRDPGTLLHLAASLEAHSEHPIGNAIVSAWQTSPGGNGPVPAELLPVASFESLPGRGIQGVIGNHRYHIGNYRQMEHLGICGPLVEEILKRMEAEGKTGVVLGNDREALGVIGIADTLRGTSREAIAGLHKLGIVSVMLTGDNKLTAQAVAAQAGIDDARGDLLPEEKLTAIDELIQTHGGHVGMVGDGINDAPALAKASIGFAMGAAGSDTAIETADVALMDDDLRKLPRFIVLSRRTYRVLRENISLAIGIKGFFFALALAGKATLWMAVFADMGASLIVVFNGMRLLRK